MSKIKIGLHGGFGEKGRTSVGISTSDCRMLFDVGIKVGATGRDYYPLISGEEIKALDALFISHAHEDHVGGLAWILAQGFQGRIFMTAETMAESPDTLSNYAENSDLSAFPFPADRIEIFQPGDNIELNGARILTGRSGHVAGGVWFAVYAQDQCIVYSADVVPDSTVLDMDPIPACDLLVLDASYGADPISGTERAVAIQQWISQNQDGCLLPTPLSGRSLELMAIMPSRFAIHASMREPLAAQIRGENCFRAGVEQRLKTALSRAQDWSEEQSLPTCPLLTDDGMGRAGPSVYAINKASKTGMPILLTGHLPEGTPAYELEEQGLADWIRLPTHPTLSGMISIWEGAEKPPVLGHSCKQELWTELATHIPTLRTDLVTGDVLEIGED